MPDLTRVYYAVLLPYAAPNPNENRGRRRSQRRFHVSTQRTPAALLMLITEVRENITSRTVTRAYRPDAVDGHSYWQEGGT
jgi:hypothetical protein